MLLKTKVKVGNITNLSDARYCAGMGVDMLGFPVGSGKNRISFETFIEITEWVAGPEFVIEFSDAMDDQLLEKVTQMESIQHIQLNFDQLGKLKSKIGNKTILLSTSTKEWIDRRSSLNTEIVSFLILNNLKSANWKEIEEINKTVPVLVSYEQLSLDIKDVTSLPISGIVLEGSVEDKPGHKNYDHLSEVLETLEVD